MPLDTAWPVRLPLGSTQQVRRRLNRLVVSVTPPAQVRCRLPVDHGQHTVRVAPYPVDETTHRQRRPRCWYTERPFGCERRVGEQLAAHVRHPPCGPHPCGPLGRRQRVTMNPLPHVRHRVRLTVGDSDGQVQAVLIRQLGAVDACLLVRFQRRVQAGAGTRVRPRR